MWEGGVEGMWEREGHITVQAGQHLSTPPGGSLGLGHGLSQGQALGHGLSLGIRRHVPILPLTLCRRLGPRVRAACLEALPLSRRWANCCCSRYCRGVGGGGGTPGGPHTATG